MTKEPTNTSLLQQVPVVSLGAWAGMISAAHDSKDIAGLEGVCIKALVRWPSVKMAVSEPVSRVAVAYPMRSPHTAFYKELSAALMNPVSTQHGITLMACCTAAAACALDEVGNAPLERAKIAALRAVGVEMDQQAEDYFNRRPAPGASS